MLLAGMVKCKSRQIHVLNDIHVNLELKSEEIEKMVCSIDTVRSTKEFVKE